MKLIECTRCGSKELSEKDGLIICAYCQSKYVPQPDDAPARETVVGIASDIEVLLQKCRADPRPWVGIRLDARRVERTAANLLVSSLQ